MLNKYLILLQLNSQNEKILISIKLRLEKYKFVRKHLKIVEVFVSKRISSNLVQVTNIQTESIIHSKVLDNK